MTPILLSIGVPCVIINADASEPDPVIFALPSRTCILAWEIAFPGGVPGTVDIDFDVAMHVEGPWTEIDGSTATTGSFRTISAATAAPLGRIDVVDSSSEQVTVTVIAKVAVP